MDDITKKYLVEKQLGKWAEQNKIFEKIDEVLLYGKTLAVNKIKGIIEVI